MFKDKMYRDLRDGLEIYERMRRDTTKNPREKIQNTSILCEFLRMEKEGDVRLAIRRCRLALIEAEKTGDASEYQYEIERYKKTVREYLEQNPKLAEELAYRREDFREKEQIDALATKILMIRKDVGRKDPFITLQLAYLDYRLGVLDKQATMQKAREVFCANRKYRVRNVYKEILKSNESISEGGLQGLSIEQLVEELADAILVAQAKAFLYDAGYSYDAVTLKNTGRRRDQVMDLVDLYFEKNGNRSMALSGTLSGVQKEDYRSDAFKKRCLFVHAALQKENRDDVCLPLYIDENTGAGIYILGKQRLGQEILIQSRKEWIERGKEGWEELACHFCYLYWGEIRQDEVTDIVSGFPVAILIDQVHGNDIEAVIREYQMSLEQNYGAFKEINCEFPTGMDERYRVYFDEEIEDEITTVEDWGRMREKELGVRR